MTDFVESVLQEAAKKQAKFKTIEVNKPIDVDIDAGNLLLSDPNPVDNKKFRASKEDFLKNLARDDAQLLINHIWELPVEKVEDAVTAVLPEPATVLPREKPIPKKRPDTRWQKYAKLKGIQNRKKGRMVWDEAHKEWRPRWGYKRANDDTKEWVLEVPDQANPYEDQFEKRSKAKKERVAKNELQRLRNIARTMKGKVPGVGLTPTDNPDKDHLNRALAVSRKATASMGQFTNKLPKEKAPKSMGKKRKFEPNIGNLDQEKKKSLDILNKISNKAPVVDVEKAANKHIASEQQNRGSSKPAGKKGKRKAQSKGGNNAGGKKARRKGRGKK